MTHSANKVNLYLNDSFYSRNTFLSSKILLPKIWIHLAFTTEHKFLPSLLSFH